MITMVDLAISLQLLQGNDELAIITMVDPTSLLQVLQQHNELTMITMVDPTSSTMVNHEADTSNMPFIRSPSAHFAKTLKETEEETYNHGRNVHTGIVVVRFDSARFVKFCDKASPKYNLSYCDYDKITKELFQTNKVWISRDLLVEVMELVAKYHGFIIHL